MTAGAPSEAQRQTIIETVARLGLPAVYPFRRFVVEGGLISFGIDPASTYRLAAGYVDLPVQAPTKYELVINLRTAKTLGLEVPLTLRGRADEVIE